VDAGLGSDSISQKSGPVFFDRPGLCCLMAEDLFLPLKLANRNPYLNSSRQPIRLPTNGAQLQITLLT
jgi:hypothetical protein